MFAQLKYRIIILITAILFSQFLFSTTLPEREQSFLKGNDAYDKGDYNLAVKEYNHILKTGFESGAVYYNLGNSYYKNGDIINAIVSYDRALRIMPGNKNLIDNLDIANLSIVDRLEEKSVLPIMNYLHDLENGYNIFTIRTIFVIVFFILILLYSITIMIYNKKTKRILNILSSLVFIYLLFTSYIFYSVSVENSIKYGIIKDDKIAIMSSPDNNVNNTTLFSLHKGTKVKVIKETENWLEISIAADKKGWLKKDNIIGI